MIGCHFKHQIHQIKYINDIKSLIKSLGGADKTKAENKQNLKLLKIVFKTNLFKNTKTSIKALNLANHTK